MAEVVISRPEANTSANVQSQADARYVFDFKSSDATISRDGNNLEIKFPDGAVVNIENFYDTHTSESLPSFRVDGQDITSDQFFTAMNEPDLVPAAGEGATSAANPVRGGRFSEYSTSDLAGGLEHLTRLDYQSNRQFEHEPGDWVTYPDAEAGTTWPQAAQNPADIEPDGPAGNKPGPVTPPDYNPEAPAAPRPVPPADPPANPAPDVDVPPVVPGSPSGSGVPDVPNHPGTPETPTGPNPPANPGFPNDPGNPNSPSFIQAGNSTIVVDEGALPGGSGQHTHHGYTGTGSITLDVHGEGGGRAEFTFTDQLGNTVIFNQLGAVPVSGQLIAPTQSASLVVNNVEVDIKGAIYDSSTGKWTVIYEYKLTDSSEHGAPGSATDDVVGFGAGNSITVTVTNFSGDTAHGNITVEIHDDVPVLTVVEPENPDASTLTGQFTANFGADGMAEIPFKVDGVEGKPGPGGSWSFAVEGGELIIKPDGGNTWSYEFKPEGEAPEGSRDFQITLVDGDKDEAHGIISIKNEKPEIIPDDPNKPENPDKPDQSGKPGTPSISVDANGMHIVVDEAALAESKGEQGAGHTEHGYKGTGSVTVQLNGGEGGVIEIGNGYSITIEKNDKDEWIAVPAGNNVIDNGTVKFTFNGATLKDPATGAWTIGFSYELTGNVEHGAPGTDSDNVLAGGVIPIKVTDSVGGDTAESQITVEIHDDVPVISATGGGEVQAGDSITGQISHAFGADLPADQIITISANGKDYQYKVGESLTIKGEKGDLTIAGDGSYVYHTADKLGGDGNDRFEFTIVDSDGDVAKAELDFTVKGETPITVTVGTPGDDSVDGDKPGGEHPPYVEGSTVLGPASEAGTPSHDIVIADVAGGSTQQGSSYNLAFMMDCSQSMRPGENKHKEDYLELAKEQVIRIINEIQKAVETDGAGEVNVMLMGFHAVAVNYTTVTLKAGDANAYNTLLQAITGLTDSTTGNWDNKWGTSSAWDNPFVSTNYELAFSYATDWFEQQAGNGYENKAFFLTDGTPTIHVRNEPLTTINPQFDVTWKNPFQVNRVDWSTYEPGKEFVADDGWGHVLYVNKDGVLFSDAGYTNPVTIKNSGGMNDTLDKFPTPVVMMKGPDGQYRPHATGGSLSSNQTGAIDKLENEEALSAWKPLDAITGGNVSAIGIGGVIPNLDRYDSQHAAMNNIDIADLADHILGSLKVDPPAADTVFGGEGRDVLLGDRLVDDLGEDANQANVDALKAAAGLDKNASAQELLAKLIGNHEKVAEALDEIDANKGGADTLIGGKDSDVLYGLGGNDVLIGDGDKGSLDQITAIIGKGGANVRGADHEKLAQIAQKLEKVQVDETREGDDILYGGHGDDILYGGGGADLLRGGTGTDYLFGGAGNDVLSGGKGVDFILAGSGNDLIVFDQNDKIIDGGSGTDILLVGKDHKGGVANINNAANVNSIEVLLKDNLHGDPEKAGIYSMATLAALGVSFVSDKLKLDQNWTLDIEKTSESVKVFEYNKNGFNLTLEVRVDNLDPATLADATSKMAIPARSRSSLPAVVAHTADEDNPYGIEGKDAIHDEAFAAHLNVQDFMEDDRNIIGAPANEVLVIDSKDYLIDGSLGVDIVATSDDDLSLKEMLELGKQEKINTEAGIPAARDIEVLIKGEGAEEITNTDDLAEYGVKYTEDGKGVELDENWKPEAAPEDESPADAIQVATYVNPAASLTLETTLVKSPLDHATEAPRPSDLNQASEAEAEEVEASNVPGTAEGEIELDQTGTGLEPEEEVRAELAMSENENQEQTPGSAAASQENESSETVANGSEASEPKETGETITLVKREEYDRLAAELEKDQEARAGDSKDEKENASEEAIVATPVEPADIGGEAYNAAQVENS